MTIRLREVTPVTRKEGGVRGPRWIADAQPDLEPIPQARLDSAQYRAWSGRDTPQQALDGVAEEWRTPTRRGGANKPREAYRPIVEFEDNNAEAAR